MNYKVRELKRKLSRWVQQRDGKNKANNQWTERRQPSKTKKTGCGKWTEPRSWGGAGGAKHRTLCASRFQTLLRWWSQRKEENWGSQVAGERRQVGKMGTVESLVVLGMDLAAKRLHPGNDDGLWAGHAWALRETEWAVSRLCQTFLTPTTRETTTISK